MVVDYFIKKEYNIENPEFSEMSGIMEKDQQKRICWNRKEALNNQSPKHSSQRIFTVSACGCIVVMIKRNRNNFIKVNVICLLSGRGLWFLNNSMISQTVRRFLILATKKCRIHAARGVSQTPKKRILGERRIIHYLQKRMIGLYENYEKRKCITQMYDRTGGRTGRSYFICCGYNSRTEKQKFD